LVQISSAVYEPSSKDFIGRRCVTLSFDPMTLKSFQQSPPNICAKFLCKFLGLFKNYNNTHMLASAGARAYMGWIGALGAGSGPNDKTKLMVRGSPPPSRSWKDLRLLHWF